MYAIKGKVSLGEKLSATGHSCSNAYNCKSVSWCYVSEIFFDIPRGVFNRNQAQMALQIHYIKLPDYDNYYIFDVILRRHKI